MKLAMRLHSSQVQPRYKFVTPGYYTIQRDIFIEAGYKTLDFLLIGGCGGAAGDSYSNSRVAQCGAAGGGGGSLRGRLSLAAMAQFTAGQVGGAGYNGTKAGNGAPGGNGSDGGHTLLGGYAAYGGGGAQGGTVYYNYTPGRDIVDPSYGGNGGGNSQGYGSGGQGGHNGSYVGWPTQFRQNPVAPTVGNYADAGGGWGGGIGGGGGFSFFRWNSAGDSGPSNGANGNMAAYGDAGSPPVGVYNGGGGGGANIIAMYGENETYGGQGRGGVMCLIFS